MSTQPPVPLEDTFRPLDDPKAIKPIDGTFKPLGPSGVDPNKAAQSLIKSQALGTDPAFAYEHGDAIQDSFKQQGVDVDDTPTSIANDIKVGLEGSIAGLAARHKMPEHLHDHSMWDNFISDVASTVADLPVYIAGALGGAVAGSEVPVVGNVAGGAVGAFALPAALREALVQGIEKGEIKDFSDLMSRTASVALEAGKGGVEGLVFEAAGGATVPLKFLGRAARPIAETALRGMQQAAAITLAGDLLNGQVPNLRDFEHNAALVGGLTLATGGLSVGKRALMDHYVKDGVHPRDAAEKLQSQPPVKPLPTEGLQPAIRVTAPDGKKTVIKGDNETHSQVAERHLGQKPIILEELEADPKLADKVLAQPEMHDQQVNDRAYEMKLDSGDSLTDIPPKEQHKSGRGFVDDKGNYLNRNAAKRWVKENEPEVYEMWKTVAGGEKSEFHSADYFEARSRMAGRNLAEGEINYSAMTPNNVRQIVSFRKDLNDAKAALGSRGFGTILRQFFTGQRDYRVALANNVRLAVRKALPDSVDRQASTLMRDYKGTEGDLQALHDEIQAGDEDALQLRLNQLKGQGADTFGLDKFEQVLSDESMARLKELMPVIERALNPSDVMKGVDGELTKYATSTFEEAKGLGIFDSSIPPDKYITHILMRGEENIDSGKGVSRSKVAKGTPYGRQRKYPTTLDAIIVGKIPRTIDAADAIAIYGERHATAVATRLWATEVKNSGLGVQGTSGRVPADWKPLSNGREFEYVVTDPKTGAQSRSTFYTPAKISDAMRAITERRTLFQDGPLGALRKVQSYIKAVDLGMSVFHMKALTISALNNMGLTNLTKAFKADINAPEFRAMLQEAASDGVTTTISKPNAEVYEGLTGKLPSRMDVLKGIPGIKQFHEMSDAIAHETFDVLQTKFKVTDYALKRAAWDTEHPEATDAQRFAARRDIAKEVNAVYGGLNWETLGWKPNNIELMRALILAPDWTFSNIYNLKYTAEGGIRGNPASQAARMFWFRSAITGMAMTQLTSLMLSGGHLSKNWTQVYLGEDKDGKEMYTDWFFAGAPKDFVTWINAVQDKGAIQGTAWTVFNKMAPITGIAPRLAANLDWSGRPITKRTQSAGEKDIRTAAFIGEQVLPAPFAVKDMARMLFDRDRDHTRWDVMSELLGGRVIHEEQRTSKGGTKRFRGQGPRFKRGEQ